ncbi:hypothetical protein NL676_032953, partial [Syzygium grande]
PPAPIATLLPSPPTIARPPTRLPPPRPLLEPPPPPAAMPLSTSSVSWCQHALLRPPDHRLPPSPALFRHPTSHAPPPLGAARYPLAIISRPCVGYRPPVHDHRHPAALDLLAIAPPPLHSSCRRLPLPSIAHHSLPLSAA